MNQVVTKYAPVLGRVLIALIFLIAGIQKLTSFGGTVGYIASKGLPMAEVLAVLSIIIEIGGAALILLGWKARFGAMVLFLFTIVVTLVYHPFWSAPEEMVHFLKNMSILGAMLYIMAYGAGSCSVDKG